ncbi:hypothetical protein BKA66DRAFT_283931 [Pyrenochaeta sp. MPI-SDFR-AT-0127]|nr:hypothetical protein BKA66DRAFT_283931 [Pyrenochaeta sp. MPI-SDFR-AT-0127]
MVKQQTAPYVSTAIFRVVEMCFSLTCKGHKRFRLFMFAFAMDKDSRAVMVAMLGKALHYLGLHAVLCHRKRSLYLFPTPSILDVHGCEVAKTGHTLVRGALKNFRIVEEEDIHLGHSFTRTEDSRLASSRCKAVRADHRTSCRSPDGAVRLRLRPVNTTSGASQTYQEANCKGARGPAAADDKNSSSSSAGTSWKRSHGIAAAAERRTSQHAATHDAL